MNELQIFEHPKFGKIRTIVEDGKTLFCGLDAANALRYKDSGKALKAHCPHRVKRRVGVETGSKADGTPAVQQIDMTFISEGDLCRLAATSEMPGAKEFEHWIFDDVIPTILRTGSYIMPGQQTSPRVNLPEGVTFSSVVGFLRIARRAILDAGGTPQDVCAMISDTCNAVSFPVSPSLTKQIPGQTSFWDRPALEGFNDA